MNPLAVLVLSAALLGSSGAAAVTPPPILFAADDLPAVAGEVYRLDANGHLVDLSKSPFRDSHAGRRARRQARRVLSLTGGGSNGSTSSGSTARACAASTRRRSTPSGAAGLGAEQQGARSRLGRP